MKTILAILATFAILYSFDSQAQSTSPGVAVVPECIALERFQNFLEKSGEKIISGGVSIRNLNGAGFTAEMFITVDPKTKEWTVFEILDGKLCALAYGINYKEFIDTRNMVLR